MDVTTVLAVICTAAVMLAWFVLPHSAAKASAATPSESMGAAEPLSATA